MRRKIQLSVLLSLSVTPLHAADFSDFPPAPEPFGHIAPVAINEYDVTDGTAQLYRPWFDNIDGSGDLLAYAISNSGTVANSASWSAKVQLDATSYSTRQLVYFNGANVADFDCATTGDGLHRFVCGDTSGEGTTYRDREAILGGIIHSQPVYVANPSAGYNFNNYLTFANNNKHRAGRIYVGANDGMLHAFDAATGNELFGYIPQAAFNKFNSWATGSGLEYFVDGELAVGDAYGAFSGTNQWRTVLVGTLGAGGKGLFALDVTDPAAANVSAVTSKFLWELDDGDLANLGYSYSKPVIAKLSNGHFGVIVGNGYANGGDGKAHLYLLPVVPNAFTPIDIPLDSANGGNISNGLSSPAVIDTNGDSVADRVYAGDLDGNLWRIDISNLAATPIPKTVLLKVQDSSNAYQPITSAPDVVRTGYGDYQISVATGELLTSSPALTSAAHQSIYGVRDHASSTFTRSNLVSQAMSSISGHSDYRTATANSVDYSSAAGWYLDLAAGEQVTQAMQTIHGLLQVMITNLTTTPEEHWLTQLDYLSGGLPDRVVFNLDNQDALNDEDNPDYLDPGNPGTRVAAIKQSGDLVSRALIARKGDLSVAYTNQWTEGTASTIPTLAAKSCTKMHFERLDFINNGTDGYDITFIAHPTDDPADDIWIKGAGLGDSNNNPAITPAAGSANRGAGSGETASGNQIWTGLSLYVDRSDVRNDRVWLNIEYDGPYQIDSFTLDLDGVRLERIHDGISTCACTGNYRACPEGDRIRYDRNNDAGVSTATFDSGAGFSFNSTISAVHDGTDMGTIPAGGGVAGTEATGTVAIEQQAGNDANIGRVRWRELLF